MILKNRLTLFKDLAVFSPQDFYDTLRYFSTLYMND